MSDVQTLPDLTADFIRRVVAATDQITYFGANSVGAALAEASAGQTMQSEAHYRALLRRDTLLGASGDMLGEVAEEYGAVRGGPQHAQTLVLVRPWSAEVTAVTGTLVEVDDSSKFEDGDSVRITLADGSVSEICTIQSISTGTGPNGGDEFDLGGLINTYDPDTTGVRLLLRKTKTAGTVFTSTTGVAFESLEDVTVGDANPVMAGESTSLALADKVLCEAVNAGEAGNVEALTITALESEDEDIRAVLNPSRAEGGTAEESDFALKFRAAHVPQIGAAETQAMLEALARRGNINVLRAFPEDSSRISTLRIRVLTRSGGGLSADERTALGSYMSQRMRSQLSVEVLNVVRTAVEVEADVTLDPGTGPAADRLAAAWRRAADRLATFLDWRKWPRGQAVDSADLLSLVNGTDGIATVATSSFYPGAEVAVDDASVPVFTRFVLRDTQSSETFGAVLATSY